MERNRQQSTTIVALCCLSACACSFLTPGINPNRPAPSEPKCAPDRGAPVVDTVMAVGGLLGGVAMVKSVSNAPSNSMGRGIGNLLLIPIGVLTSVYGISALAGYSKAKHCREERGRWQTWKEEHPATVRKIRCDDRQKSVFSESDLAKRAAMINGLPADCRGRVDDLAKVHSQVLAAVTKRECDLAEGLARQIKKISPKYYRAVLLKDPQLETCIGPVHVDCAIVGYKNLQEARVTIRSDATIVAREYKVVVSVHSQGEVSRTGVVEGKVGPGKTETRLFRGFPLGRTLDSCSVAVDSAALDAARVGPQRFPAR